MLGLLVSALKNSEISFDPAWLVFFKDATSSVARALPSISALLRLQTSFQSDPTASNLAQLDLRKELQ